MKSTKLLLCFLLMVGLTVVASHKAFSAYGNAKADTMAAPEEQPMDEAAAPMMEDQGAMPAEQPMMNAEGMMNAAQGTMEEAADAMAKPEMELTGTIVSVNAEDKKVEIKYLEGDSEMTAEFQLEETAKIMSNDEEISLVMLSEGDNVAVQFHPDEEGNKVVSALILVK